ncbi:MAG: sensor histidine kinase [Dermatophilaceae bacterium]
MVPRGTDGARRPAPRRRRGALRRSTTRLGRWLGRGASAASRHPDLVLALLASMVFVIAWPTIQVSHDVPASLMPVLAVCEALPLVLLRHAPFAGWVVAAATSATWWVLVPALPASPMPWPVVQFLVLLATVVAVGLRGRWREVPVVVVVTGGLFLALPEDLRPWVVGQALVMGVAILLRWLLSSRRQIAAQRVEVETERARRAVVEERGRIARELHDVVAHHMSMIVVQAQSAPVRHEVCDDRLVEEFAAIEGSARQALTEVRSVLGVLRDEDGPVATAPQPDLRDLPALLASSTAAGMSLTSHVDIDAGAVPPGTALVLYRVAQESLSNAARHAPGAAVELTLEEEAGWARLVVRSAPAGRGSPAPEGEPDGPAGGSADGGSGIRGMSERVRAVGGTLRAEPVGAGFVVAASVPLTGRPGVTTARGGAST